MRNISMRQHNENHDRWSTFSYSRHAALLRGDIIRSIHTWNVAHTWRRKRHCWNFRHTLQKYRSIHSHQKCCTQMAPLLDTENDTRKFHDWKISNEMSCTDDIIHFYRKEMMSFSFTKAKTSSVSKMFVTERNTSLLWKQQTLHSGDVHHVTTRDKADHVAGRYNDECHDETTQSMPLRNNTLHLTTKE